MLTLSNALPLALQVQSVKHGDCASVVRPLGQWSSLERKANTQANLAARVFICSDNSQFIRWLYGSSVQNTDFVLIYMSTVWV